MRLLAAVLLALVFVSSVPARPLDKQVGLLIPIVAVDDGLTPIAAAISGVAVTQAHCGGVPWFAYGAVYLEAGEPLPHLFLDPTLCKKLHRFQNGWRPNAACLRRVPRCETSYVSLSALVLTHESAHVSGDLDEASAECKAIQGVRETIGLLGETNVLYVDALVRYALWWHVEETKVIDWRSGTRVYYSPKCKSNGDWDLTPADGLWP